MPAVSSGARAQMELQSRLTGTSPSLYGVDEGAQDQLAAYLKNGGVKPEAAPSAGEFTQAKPRYPNWCC